MAEPVATVVVTNHDYEAYVVEAVASAVAQGRPDAPVQVVVVDDGSTDRSLEALSGAPGPVEVIAQPNRGQGSAFNAGFAAAQAPIVLFLDADDLLDPDAVAKVVEALDADPRAVRVQFPLRRIGARGQPLGGTVPSDPRRLPRGDLAQDVLDHGDDLGWMPTSGNAFRHAALARILPMPEPPFRISADHYLSNLTPLLGGVTVLERPMGSYRIHGRNADHRAHLDLARVRDVIVRTRATRAEVERLAADLGLRPPPAPADAVRAVSAAANRLVSLRLEPERHPVEGDRAGALFRAGTRAALSRPDLGWARRVLAVGFLGALALAPKATLPWIAERGLRG